MPEVTLKLSDSVYKNFQKEAKRTGQSINVLLNEWIEHNVPIAYLSDEEVLQLADMMMSAEQQDELNTLLEFNSEGQITEQQQLRLSELMSIYRKGLVRKAEAMKAVVERGLRSANVDEWPETEA